MRGFAERADVGEVERFLAEGTAAEHYDFAVPADRWERPAVAVLRRLLTLGSALRRELGGNGIAAADGARA